MPSGENRRGGSAYSAKMKWPGRHYNQCYNAFVQTKLRKIGNGYGVLLPKQVIERLRVTEGSVLNLTETSSGIELSPFDANFSEQVEAFRRTESRHRNSYRELAK